MTNGMYRKYSVHCLGVDMQILLTALSDIKWILCFLSIAKRSIYIFTDSFHKKKLNQSWDMNTRGRCRHNIYSGLDRQPADQVKPGGMQIKIAAACFVFNVSPPE